MNKLRRRLFTGILLYSGTSYYFLKHPELLHQKKDNLKLPPLKLTHYSVAHRGGSVENPENTLQGFKAALLKGVDVLETDVRMTKDGKIIVCHDENFFRLTGQNNLVKDINYEELPMLQEKIPLHFSKGLYYKVKDADQRHYTLLEDVFEQLPKDVVIQIDLKDKSNVNSKNELIRLIHKYDRVQTSIIGAERESDIREMHRIDPSIPKFISGDEVVKYLVLYYTGLLPFVHIYQDVLAIPYLTRDYLRMKLIEAREISPLLYFYITLTLVANMTINPMIEHMNKRGIFTNYWVINDDDEIRKVLQTTKVQGIMSDRPSRVQEILREEESMLRQKEQRERQMFKLENLI